MNDTEQFFHNFGKTLEFFTSKVSELKDLASSLERKSEKLKDKGLELDITEKSLKKYGKLLDKRELDVKIDKETAGKITSEAIKQRDDATLIRNTAVVLKDKIDKELIEYKKKKKELSTLVEKEKNLKQREEDIEYEASLIVKDKQEVKLQRKNLADKQRLVDKKLRSIEERTKNYKKAEPIKS